MVSEDARICVCACNHTVIFQSTPLNIMSDEMKSISYVWHRSSMCSTSPYPSYFSIFCAFMQKRSIFSLFFDHSTLIAVTWHRWKKLFCEHSICHDVPNILQAKVRCSVMSATDRKMKLTSKNAVFSLWKSITNELDT